jgi:HK97 family phage prohead protease
MDYKQLPQAEASTDESGAFVAVVSAFSLDRQGERIRPGAFRRTLAKWRKSNRMIPVLADHEGSVGHVVGRIDPRLTVETAEGLEASGTLDLSTEFGRRVYELVKAGTLAWSIGFRVPKGGRRRRGDHTEITEIDLAEVSAVATPANADTRTVSLKALSSDASMMSDDELREASLAAIKGIETRPLKIASFRC